MPAKTFSVTDGKTSALLAISWMSGDGNTIPGTAMILPGTGHLTVRLQLIGPAGNTLAPTLRGWIVPGILGAGWPFTPHQCEMIERMLKTEISAPRSDPTGVAFGTRLEELFTAFLTSLTQANAMSRMTSVTYQRKRLRERFGSPELVTSGGSIIGHKPFAIVWECPLKGSGDAAVRGLVKMRGGKSLLEHVLVTPNSKGVAHTLSAEDVAEALLRIENTLRSLDVRDSLLAGTEVDVNPRLPTSSAFWHKAKRGIDYTSVKLLRMDAGCWSLIMARRISGGHRVNPTVITLSLSAGVAALIGHMKVRGLTMKHHSSWRLMRMMAEWREHIEQRTREANNRLDKKPEPNGTPVESDVLYERLRNELVELISQDESILHDLDALRHDDNFGNLDRR